MRPMQEIELKFQIPADALATVQDELACLNQGSRKPIEAIALRAAYFDTPKRQLAQARMALRVRQEGDEWVQTLKSGGSNTMVRLEDNRPARPAPPGEPLTADLSRHSEAAQKALSQALAWQPAQDPNGERVGLVELYRTDITRHRAHLSVGEGTPFEGKVELALDLGHIMAGNLSVPVRELEIELLAGHPMAVVLAGHDWVKRRGLWLDTQTKAHRGDALARQATAQANPNPPEAADQAITQLRTLNEGKLPRAAANKSRRSPDAVMEAEVSQALEHFTTAMSALGAAAQASENTFAPALAQAQRAVRALRRLRALARLIESRTFKRVASASLKQAQKVSQQLSARIAAARPLQEASALRAIARSPEVSALCLEVLGGLLPAPQAVVAPTVDRAKAWEHKPITHKNKTEGRGRAEAKVTGSGAKQRSGKGFANASGKSAFKPARKATVGPKR